MAEPDDHQQVDGLDQRDEARPPRSCARAAARCTAAVASIGAGHQGEGHQDLAAAGHQVGPVGETDDRLQPERAQGDGGADDHEPHPSHCSRARSRAVADRQRAEVRQHHPTRPGRPIPPPAAGARGRGHGPMPPNAGDDDDDHRPTGRPRRRDSGEVIRPSGVHDQEHRDKTPAPVPTATGQPWADPANGEGSRRRPPG